MTDDPKYTPPEDPTQLQADCLAVKDACHRICMTIIEGLSSARQGALGQVVQGGGRLGVSVLIDRRGRCFVDMVAGEQEGALHTLAHVWMAAPPDVAH